jgi:hypothetical protein
MRNTKFTETQIVAILVIYQNDATLSNVYFQSKIVNCSLALNSILKRIELILM